jgi:prophage tail gpP-like protein
MPILPGQSELDSLRVAVPDLGLGVELTSVESFTLQSSVLTPADAWHLTLDGDAEGADLLVPGLQIQFFVNDKPQLYGTIDRVNVTAGKAGTQVTLSGRDLMGLVVDAVMMPTFRVTETMTLGDVMAAALVPLGVTRIYNDGSINVSVQTGIAMASKPSTQAITVQVPTATLQADGTLGTTYESSSSSLVTTSKPGLTTLKLNAAKPHQGEGVHAFLDRLLKRFGLRMYAMADGSGIVVDRPDFTTTPTHSFIHSLTSTDANNIEEGNVTYDLVSQPSCIVAFGTGAPEGDLTPTTMRVICINELAGTDINGQPLKSVQDVITRYKGAKVLPMRPQLLASRKLFATNLTSRPMFEKDDESHTTDQLANFARRKMAERMHKALHLNYEAEGWSLDGVPFAINTNVSVSDDRFKIHGPLYTLDREFMKSRSGTNSRITLALPYSIDFAST